MQSLNGQTCLEKQGIKARKEQTSRNEWKRNTLSIQRH